jgi:serine/threonine protein kinase
MPKRDVFTLKGKDLFYNDLRLTPNRFSISKYLGRGANGSVFQAFDKQLDRFVALKFWYPSINKQHLAKAKNEIRKLAPINNSSFATVYDVRSTGPIVWMVMELIEGFALKTIINNLPILDKVTIWAEFSGALNNIYSKNIYHGDPHLGNILITRKFVESPKSVGSPKWEWGEKILKIVDLGTSRVRKNHDHFLSREISVLKETFSRLFPTFPFETYLKFQAFDTPQNTLKTLDACNDLNANFMRAMTASKNEAESSNTLYRNVVASIGCKIMDLPIMKLENIWQKLLEMQIPDNVLSFFLGIICSVEDPYRPGSAEILGTFKKEDFDSVAVPRYLEIQEKFISDSNLTAWIS